MDPDGDYESRHSTRSTANDVASPSEIFAPNDDDAKPHAKSMKGPDAYEGPTAPPMEVALLPAAAAAAAANIRSAMEPLGTAYNDLMSGKRDIAELDEAPISNSVAVPIGFDSDDMALPEAKALPVIHSTANEGTKMPSATLEEVDAEEDTEAQVDEEEPTPVPVPSSSDDGTSSNAPSVVEEEGKDTTTTDTCTRKQKCVACIVLGIVALGVLFFCLFGTAEGQLLLKGYGNCHVDDPYWIGDSVCDGGVYNTAECGWDGGDCLIDGYPHCHVDRPNLIGNGYCDNGDHNTAECGWDGGDCVKLNEFNVQHPNCNVAWKDNVGDGSCDIEYNTAECGWDGGDCDLYNSYPDCRIDEPYKIGNGICNVYRGYNTAECGWDGGDCLFVLLHNGDKECVGEIAYSGTDKALAWCQQQCIDAGTDCTAYDHTWSDNRCRLFSRFSSTTSNDDSRCWKKKESALVASALATESTSNNGQADDVIEKLGTCVDSKTMNVVMQCIQGVLSTLDPDVIGKLAQCAGGESISEMQTCVEEQLSGS